MLTDRVNLISVDSHLGLQRGDWLTELTPLQALEGHRALVELQFEPPMSLTHHDKLIVRDTAASSTLGGAQVLELRPA
ncbi:hypothetical protein KT99_08273 [Shewanella benthica KT99]|uniref:Selenocysteine-specific elongation factor beta-barrel domain-containing protein n=2 Tax=Shewanella benthica TaxID=43661 RepID=A9D1N4_9GAMM|nr:hypothetical protein KT99_08273 [Shewanella benthica KT99]